MGAKSGARSGAASDLSGGIGEELRVVRKAYQMDPHRPYQVLAPDQYSGRSQTDYTMRHCNNCAAETLKALMLYELYDWHRSALQPWRLLAQAANELYGHPYSPLSFVPGSRNMAAAFDLMTRLTQRYERPEFGITEIQSGGRTCKVTERYEHEKSFCRLLHFVKEGAPRQPRVLLFAP